MEQRILKGNASLIEVQEKTTAPTKAAWWKIRLSSRTLERIAFLVISLGLLFASATGALVSTFGKWIAGLNAPGVEPATEPAVPAAKPAPRRARPRPTKTEPADVLPGMPVDD